MKDLREPLESIVIAGFLSCVGGPVTGTISGLIASAGLALGLRALRTEDAEPGLKRWSLRGEIFAWCACALAAVTWLLPWASVAWGALDMAAWFSTATALRILAERLGSRSLVRWSSIARWAVLAPLLLLPLLLLAVRAGWLHERKPPPGLMIEIGSGLVLAIVALRLRKIAPPCGERVREQSA